MFKLQFRFTVVWTLFDFFFSMQLSHGLYNEMLYWYNIDLYYIINWVSLMILSYDIVLDASDNVATRYLLNDACILSQKPLVSGSALRFEGQVWYIWLYETKLVKVLADNILQEAFFKISLFVKYIYIYYLIFVVQLQWLVLL